MSAFDWAVAKTELEQVFALDLVLPTGVQTGFGDWNGSEQMAVREDEESLCCGLLCCFFSWFHGYPHIVSVS